MTSLCSVDTLFAIVAFVNFFLSPFGISLVSAQTWKRKKWYHCNLNLDQNETDESYLYVQINVSKKWSKDEGKKPPKKRTYSLKARHTRIQMTEFVKKITRSSLSDIFLHVWWNSFFFLMREYTVLFAGEFLLLEFIVKRLLLFHLENLIHDILFTQLRYSKDVFPHFSRQITINVASLLTEW